MCLRCEEAPWGGDKNLTRENFFDEMQQKYPQAAGRFSQWLEKYKDDGVNWKYFFSSREPARRSGPFEFEKMPLPFQLGIFMQYIDESHKRMIVEDPYWHGLLDMSLFRVPREFIEMYFGVEELSRRPEFENQKRTI
jgi:hypothetical protein